MKRVLVLGATGRIGKLLVSMMQQEDVQLSIYVRSPEKVPREWSNRVDVIQGDVMDESTLTGAMVCQDIIVGVLSGELLSYAENITRAMEDKNLQRIIWVTGMGIHHEVPGEVGKMLDELCIKFPECVQAADAIAASTVPYTLVRAAHLTDGNNTEYHVQHEGEPLNSNSVDRIAVARFIKDMILSETGINESLGVTN